MPRTARLDAPGVVHHVMIRGIESRSIFINDQDREDFLERLATLLPETKTVTDDYQIDSSAVFLKSRRKNIVEARSLICYFAVRELGMSLTSIAKEWGSCLSSVGYAVLRGEKIVNAKKYHLKF